jgi:uncharacterized protein YjbI with pentapeptide repeats
MANTEHLNYLKQGISVWNEWREKNPDVIPDLRQVDLTGGNLTGVDFHEANLNAAILDDTNLHRASLRNAKMNRISLCRANLSKADLNNASLRGGIAREAGFVKSNLANASFTGTDLYRSDFSFAHLTDTVFNNVDLREIQGLTTVKHFGPSVIDIATLYKSEGNIPEIFLRGCGIPDDFIAFIPTYFKIEKAVEFYSCFISYSTKDEEFAKKLHSRMQAEHLRVWFAPEDIKGGSKILEQVEHAIQLHDKLLLVLSENSMQSEWVMTEIRNARRVEINGKKRKLFPIRLVDFEYIKRWQCFDGESGKDLAVEIREYFIPDFSNWNDENAFEEAFERLLRDLTAKDS